MRPLSHARRLLSLAQPRIAIRSDSYFCTCTPCTEPYLIRWCAPSISFKGRRAVRATPPRHVRRGRFLSSRAHAVRLFRLWYRACDGPWAPLALTCATFLASARATKRSRIPCIVAAGLHGNIEHTGSFKDRDRHFDCHFTRCKDRDRTMRPLPCSLATLALRRPCGPLH